MNWKRAVAPPLRQEIDRETIKSSKIINFASVDEIFPRAVAMQELQDAFLADGVLELRPLCVQI